MNKIIQFCKNAFDRTDKFSFEISSDYHFGKNIRIKLRHNNKIAARIVTDEDIEYLEIILPEMIEQLKEYEKL